MAEDRKIIPAAVDVTGGSAYPTKSDSGLTIRDYFAAAALTGLIMHDHCDDGDEVGQAVSEFSYQYADQMLRAREPK